MQQPMDSDSEIAVDYSPRFLIYKNGRIERLVPETFVPPSLNPTNGVISKDAVYSPENDLSLRIYLPEKAVKTGEEEKKKKKLPLLVYFHGGGFIMETRFTSTYHTFLTSSVAAADCVAVSVDYRRAPEHPIPIAYEDSWDAIKWIFTHIAGSGPEDWLNENADFGRVFLAGDSAGANIAHHMGIRAGKEKKLNLNDDDSGDFKIFGMALFCPYFWSKAPIDEHETTEVAARRRVEGMWEIASPNSKNGVDDPWFNVVGSDLTGLSVGRVFVMVAGNDIFVRQGLGYAAKLEKSGWQGKVELVEIKDEGHVFHIRVPDSDNARRVLQRFAEFLNDETS
uniref:Putative carboxylesterase 1 n=1 Tax=Noccaea caerulescens TaxID=107243 RepID=A0A1J3JZG5_NOCCA